MESDREIGGFFGLELPVFDNFPQVREENYALLNSGRCALEFILHSLGTVVRVYLTRYTCPTVLVPLERLGIPYEFYRITPDLEVVEESLPVLREGEYVLYTHYFGIKERYIDTLADKYRGHLLIDSTLAFYSPARKGIPVFYSPRKFSGVADGGIAVMSSPSSVPEARETSHGFSGYLLQRLEQGGESAAAGCQESEDRLRNAPMRRMSLLTERLLRGVDYESAARRRMSNFLYLHERLAGLNKLCPDTENMSAPFCYPFWTNLPGLRNELIDRRILIPCLWPEVLERSSPGSVECNLALGLLPLPVDQRYDHAEMNIIIRAIEKYYN